MSQQRSNLLYIFVIAVAIVVLLAFLPLTMMSGWRGMMGSGMMGWNQWGLGFGWGHMIIGGILFLVFLGLIVVGLYYLLSGRGVSEPEDRSLEILRERFAKGEIDEEHFKKMRGQLRG